jgi:hypothetical protein
MPIIRVITFHMEEFMKQYGILKRPDWNEKFGM